MSVVIVRRRDWIFRIFGVFIITMLCVGLSFGAYKVIKSFKLDVSLEQPAVFSTDMPDDLLSPAGNVYTYNFNVSNSVSQDLNYTVTATVTPCNNTLAKIVVNGSSGYCTAKKTFLVGNKGLVSSNMKFQFNTSAPTGDYDLNVSVTQDDFKYVI